MIEGRDYDYEKRVITMNYVLKMWAINERLNTEYRKKQYKHKDLTKQYSNISNTAKSTYSRK
jgi:hypothetical protein